MGELTECERFFSKVCLYTVLCLLYVTSDKCRSHPGTGGGWNLCSAFRQKGGEQRALLAPLVSKLPSAQSNQYAKLVHFGVVYPDPFQQPRNFQNVCTGWITHIHTKSLRICSNKVALIQVCITNSYYH